MEQSSRPAIDRLDLRLLDILQRQGALSVADVAAKTKLHNVLAPHPTT
jgi:DNA-binding Lrp family transcriptional regulator